MSWGVLPWVYPVWDSLGFLDLGGYFLPHFREVFSYYLLEYFLMAFLLLSIVKQITSPGGMHETNAWSWCTGKTQRNWVEREVGGGIRMRNACNSMAESCQCMTKPTAMLWSNYLPTNKNKWKKKPMLKRIFVNM